MRLWDMDFQGISMMTFTPFQMSGFISAHQEEAVQHVISASSGLG
jgi:hypothetical protein